MEKVRAGSEQTGCQTRWPITIRPWCDADLSEVARLYCLTVQRINRRDYTGAQIDAWAPAPWPDGFWRERFQRYQVFIAERLSQLVGFAEFDPKDGHVDCFYVHHAQQHRGIGRTLMQEILKAAEDADIDRLHADVSLTAKPFFQAMGFVSLEERQVLYRGDSFCQFKMERILRNTSEQ